MASTDPSGSPSACRRASCKCPISRSFPSSRATAPGPTSGARRSASSTPRWRRPTAASARSPGRRCSPARRRSTRVEQLAARRDGRGLQEVPRRHQGPADHAGRRRHPLAQRRAAPDARSLRLPAPGALLQGRAVSPVKQPEEVDMVIFRENTEDIYAGIEWAAGEPPRSQEGHRLPREARWSVEEDPLPAPPAASASSRSRARAPSAWCAPRSSYALRQQAPQRDAGAQGQHHEVHRGRLPRLGLRAGARASSASEVVTERESWILGNQRVERRTSRSRTTPS